MAQFDDSVAGRLEEVARGLRDGVIRAGVYVDGLRWRYGQEASPRDWAALTAKEVLSLDFTVVAAREVPVGRPVLTREEASVAVLRLLGFYRAPGSARWQRDATAERGYAHGFSGTPDVFTQAELLWELVEHYGMTVRPYSGGWLAGAGRPARTGAVGWGRPSRADAIVDCALELEGIRAEFPDERREG